MMNLVIFIPLMCSPIKLSRTPATYRSAPPALGGDTRAVLDALGIDAATQQRLFDAGVLKADLLKADALD